MTDRYNSAANLNPRNTTGRIYRAQLLAKMRAEEEEKRKKSEDIDYGEYLTAAEFQALEEHPSGAIDFEEARSYGSG